jgi:two-component system, NarL family, response regulator NreC
VPAHARRPLRLVLVEGHAVVRRGLRRMLEARPGWTVEAEAGDLDAGVRATLGHRPDVVLLDLHLGDRASLATIPDLLARAPQTRIVVLTMQADPACAREALRSGASGYVLKEAAEEELVRAIEAAAGGASYVHPRLGGPPAPEGAVAGTLTPREREVLGLLARGRPNAEIAEQLRLSRRTVETHRANVQRKLGLGTRAELTRYALEHGLLSA